VCVFCVLFSSSLKYKSTRYPVLVASGLQRVMPHVSVNVVRDASYVNTGSLSTALCVDTLIGTKHAEESLPVARFVVLTIALSYVYLYVCYSF
jgi:hypothetical protein